jgi:hypothetical protein
MVTMFHRGTAISVEVFGSRSVLLVASHSGVPGDSRVWTARSSVHFPSSNDLIVAEDMWSPRIVGLFRLRPRALVSSPHAILSPLLLYSSRTNLRSPIWKPTIASWVSWDTWRPAALTRVKRKKRAESSIPLSVEKDHQIIVAVRTLQDSRST